ncbi:hypothetical protein [Tateyamaria pelophila]|uniref:hypothetical protein n=1 Tax=Tateyamaria pelophila TaxID=328415 RepID=UPI001CBF1701|nr:hypothetical protein [Tateyamaria pelophila]
MSNNLEITNEEKRLHVIFSVVAIAHEMRELGFPKTAYSKILRETIFFVWEIRELSKYSPMRKRSKAAEGRRNDKLDYDHAIPMRIIIEMLLNKWPNKEAVTYIITHLVHGVLITKEEHILLSEEGLSSTMPKDWDGSDWMTRYKKVGIDLI